MKRIMLISKEPDFFEQKEHAIDKRDVELFPAMSFDEAQKLIEHLSFQLIIINHCNDSVVSSGSVPLIKKIVKESQIPVILIVKEIHSGVTKSVFEDVPALFIVTYPISFNYLLELNKKLLNQPMRKYVRILIQIKRILGEGQTKTVFGFSRNMSDTGMLLETETDFKIGDTMFFSFMIPGSSRMIEIKAQVVRTQKNKGSTAKFYGVHFIDISPTDKEIVLRFVTKNN